MSALSVGAMAAALVAWFIWRRKAPRVTVWLSLIAGLTIGVGLLGQLANRIATALVNATSSGTALLVGVAVPAVIGVIVLAELWYGGTRSGQPHRYWHAVLAFLAPVLLLSAGGIFATIAGFAESGVNVVPALFSSFGG